MAQYAAGFQDYLYGSNNGYYPSDRLTVSSGVRLPGANINFVTGGLLPDNQFRRRTQAKRIQMEEYGEEEKKLKAHMEKQNALRGIRINSGTGIILVLAILLICAVMLLVSFGQVTNLQDKITRTRRSVTEYQVQNREIEAQIKAARDASVICYYAAKNLDMIPAESAKAIHLRVPTMNATEIASAEEVSMN